MIRTIALTATIKKIQMTGIGYSFKDQCHLLLFRHLPRVRRQVELSHISMNSLIMKNELEGIVPQGSDDDGKTKETDDDSSDSQLLILLIAELIKNEFEKDLYIKDNNDINHKAVYDHKKAAKIRHYTLLAIVNEKLQCKMHKIRLGSPLSRAEMLSLILYTGCDCNYDLCKFQRNGDYKKWYYFDKCLYNAIKKLNERETYSNNMKLYSGLSGVQLNQSKLALAYFPTYVSTSYIKDVSISFMVQDTAFANGMMMELNENIAQNFICCSVTWVSKFRDECEILIARTVNTTNAATLSVVEHEHKQKDLNDKYSKINYQTVKLDCFNQNKDGIILFNTQHVNIWNIMFSKIFLFEKLQC